MFTESFENGLAQWQLGNNANGEYDFTVMGCKTHSGNWSADPVRGGFRGQYAACWDAYPANVTTQITHSACESIAGAAQAWLDFYFTSDMDNSEVIGVYYLGPDGYLWGYQFIGSWPGWYRIVLNLKQWIVLGDVTAMSCPRTIFQFRSDASNTAGTGLALDDVTIRTDSPPFLGCSIMATPASGPASLTVSFVPNITGASGSETYDWRFGDAASTASTSRNPTFTYTTAGDYWVRLGVADASGNRGFAHRKITVTAGGACSLSCTATAPASATAGKAVSFSATATPSGCSGNPAFLWTFGDGQTSTQQNPSHTYASAATYTWTMTATAGGTSCTKRGPIWVTTSPLTTPKRRIIAPSPGAAPLSTTTIGPSGGTVSGSGFTLTVPPGHSEAARP